MLSPFYMIALAGGALVIGAHASLVTWDVPCAPSESASRLDPYPIGLS